MYVTRSPCPVEARVRMFCSAFRRVPPGSDAKQKRRNQKQHMYIDHMSDLVIVIIGATSLIDLLLTFKTGELAHGSLFFINAHATPRSMVIVKTHTKSTCYFWLTVKIGALFSIP